MKQNIERIVEKNEKIINAPVRVAFYGLIFFGGSFFALKKYQAGVFFTFIGFALLLFLLNRAAIISIEFEQFVGLNLDKPYAFLILSGLSLLFAIIWWLSIILPVNMCRPVFFYQNVNSKTLWYIWFLPFLPYYWQGKFKRGHITGLGFLLFPSMLLTLSVFYTQMHFSWITPLNEKVMAYAWLILFYSILMMMISWISNALEVLQVYHGVKRNLNNYRWIAVSLMLVLTTFIMVFILKNPEHIASLKSTVIEFINLLR